VVKLVGNRAAELITELQTYVGQSSGGFSKDVCLLRVLCVVRQRSQRRAGHSSRGVLPWCVSLSVVKCNETLDTYSEYVARGQTRNERWKMLKHLIFYLFV
jgi:hypothetical protein